MTTLSFSHPDLHIKEALTTQIEAVGRDYLILKSHPDVKIPVDGKKIKELKLEPDTEVKIDPHGYTLTVTTVPAQAVSSGSKRHSSPAFGVRYHDVLR